MKEKMLWFCEEGAGYFLKFQIKRPDSAVVGWPVSELEDLWERMGREVIKIKLEKGEVLGG